MPLLVHHIRGTCQCYQYDLSLLMLALITWSREKSEASPLLPLHDFYTQMVYCTEMGTCAVGEILSVISSL